MELTNDKIIKDFFSENKTEIADNGFSQRLIRKLPEEQNRGWIVWVFAAVGMSIALYAGINVGLIKTIFLSLHSISGYFYYLLGAVAVFPLLFSLLLYLNQNEQSRLV